MRELALYPVTRAEKLSGVRRSITSAVALAGPFLLAACNQTGGLKAGWELFMSSLEPNPRREQAPLASVGAVLPPALEACRRTIADQATAHGAIQVDVISAGTTRRLPNGVNEAAVEVRITYRREDQVQIRQADVTCQLDDNGSVVALL